MWVLADYPMQRILDAMAEYVKRKSDIPAPADIVNIIDPPPPVLSGAAYIGLRKKIADDVYLTPEDREFLRAYEKQETAKVRGGSEDFLNAQREIEHYKSQKQNLIEDWT